MKKDLVIIPARKGSKRIKNKNLVKILKKPLIWWTIDYAKKIKTNNVDIIVSSDCNKIKKICTKEKIYFLKRPEKICSDNTKMNEVIFNVLQNLKEKYRYIILLQPTSPLRDKSLFESSLKILNIKKQFDSLIHVAKNKKFTGIIKNNMWNPSYKKNIRSQDIEYSYVSTGNIFVYRSKLFEKKIKSPKKTYALTSNHKWVDIDNPEDLLVFKSYLK